MQLIVDNAQVSYTMRGTGDNLIFVHGWLDSKETFEPLINELKNDFHCIAVDLPNFGSSQQDSNITTVNKYAEFLASFVKKLDVGDYAIVGHSMGGQIITYGIGEGIIKPRKTILIASAGIRDNQQLVKLMLKYSTKIIKMITPNTIKDILYKKMGSDYRTNLNPIHKKIINAVLTTDIQSQSLKVNCPTLLIYGDIDKHTPPKFGEKLHNNIKNSKLVIIADQDHWVHKKAAKETSLEIRKFINE